MRKDLDELDIEFNDRAREAYYTLYNKFETAVKHLDRQKDENVFQQTLGQYIHTMKSELEGIALDLIQKNQSMIEVNYLKRNLTNRINEYIREFRMKSLGH